MGTKPAPKEIRNTKGDSYRWMTMSRAIPFLDRLPEGFFAEVDRLIAEKREAT